MKVLKTPETNELSPVAFKKLGVLLGKNHVHGRQCVPDTVPEPGPRGVRFLTFSVSDSISPSVNAGAG